MSSFNYICSYNDKPLCFALFLGDDDWEKLLKGQFVVILSEWNDNVKYYLKQRRQGQEWKR